MCSEVHFLETQIVLCNRHFRLGLGALKFASQLEFGPGTKIFLLFDNDSSYTNSLREMIDVSTQLSARGIILNTVNAYDMRRGIIVLLHFSKFKYQLKLSDPSTVITKCSNLLSIYCC